MKHNAKLFAFFTLFLLTVTISGISTGVLAANRETLQDDSLCSGYSLSHKSINPWDRGGSPDDYGGEFSLDGSPDNRAYLVADPSPGRIDELRTLLGNDVTIIPCKYSYDELLQVQAEINDLSLLDSPIKIYYTSIGGDFMGKSSGGFGESGKEFRVVVGVDKSELDRYSAEFARRYGDMVALEAFDGPIQYNFPLLISEIPFQLDYGQPISEITSGALSSSNNRENRNTLILPTVVAICLLVGILAIVLWRRRCRV